MTVLATDTGLSEHVEQLRKTAAQCLDPRERVKLGQFLTPATIAMLMGSMLPQSTPEVRLLDAGAGVGSLLAAGVEALASAPKPPRRIEVTAYEIDPALIAQLDTTLNLCFRYCAERDIVFQGTLLPLDFVAHATERLRNPLLYHNTAHFTHAVLNPPYRKINSSSQHRRLLRAVGIETSNLYTGFIALAIKLLEDNGALVAITPRSFCNGPYFRPFRSLLLNEMALRELHVFEERDQAFSDDGVLQENIILAATKSVERPVSVRITASRSPDDEAPLVRDVPYAEVVLPDDAEQFIRLVVDATGQYIASAIGRLSTGLAELGIAVSTGRVVDFRAAEHLRNDPEDCCAPLIYPSHLERNGVTWPKLSGKKPNAIIQSAATAALLVPNERYVLVKRFSAKEEPRRVTAVVYEPLPAPTNAVGFENHLNYFHSSGRGLDADLAYGLAAYLNSSFVDTYVRQFSGHTQVNATDLRTLRYPLIEQLRAIGRRVASKTLSQSSLDSLLAEELTMLDLPEELQRAQKRITEAIDLLRELGFPRAQLNERSALTLLALLDITPERPWAEAQSPLRGITPMMEFFALHYGRHYKPNTRETVRRQTVHQFLDAGLVLANPDDPARPVNSPKAVYQIEANALRLLRTYTTLSGHALSTPILPR